MAKDLPYFKFVISEWNDGDVTLCSLEAQGLFINLCSIYWSQEGNMSLAKSKRRFSNCNADAWEQLEKDKVIKVKGDRIIINFLDEQFKERGKLSNTNSENASKGWEKRRNNATEMRPHTDGVIPASNKEEKRTEKKKKEENKTEAANAEVIVWPSFEDFWEKYDKKIGKPKSLELWKKIEQVAREKIMGHLVLYSLTEKRYRKDPERYLRNKTWEDEVITTTNGTRTNDKRTEQITGLAAGFAARHGSGD